MTEMDAAQAQQALLLAALAKAIVIIAVAAALAILAGIALGGDHM